LHDVDLAARGDGIRQSDAIPQQHTVDKNRDVVANDTLLVQDVAAKRRVSPKCFI
jgi:hypothetical protein